MFIINVGTRFSCLAYGRVVVVVVLEEVEEVVVELVSVFGQASITLCHPGKYALSSATSSSIQSSTCCFSGSVRVWPRNTLWAYSTILHCRV